MPVTRATHEALKTAHAALKEKYRQNLAEQTNNQRADEATADTITRLSTELDALRRITAWTVRELELGGMTVLAYSLRRQLDNNDVDLSAELNREPAGVPATIRYTASEGRLVAELHRRTKALEACKDQCRELQRVNEEQARQLRDHAAAPAPVEGSAA